MIALDELERVFTGWHERYWKRWRKETSLQNETIALFAPFNEKLDGSGNGDVQIFQNTTSHIAVLGRVILWADGYTPAAPWSSGWLALYSGQVFNAASIWDMLPTSPGSEVFPNVAEYSGLNAIRLKQNETLSAHVVGGPANVNVTGVAIGFLRPYTSPED